MDMCKLLTMMIVRKRHDQGDLTVTSCDCGTNSCEGKELLAYEMGYAGRSAQDRRHHPTMKAKSKEPWRASFEPRYAPNVLVTPGRLPPSDCMHCRATSVQHRAGKRGRRHAPLRRDRRHGVLIAYGDDEGRRQKVL